jgi:predicted dehydrogenase
MLQRYAPRPMSTLRCAVIGAGWAGATLCEALRYVPGAQLVAVAGGSRAPDLAATYHVESVADPDALLGDPRVDAVLVASPHAVHCAQTLKAARARKHVFVEKPMATTVGDCEAMIDACREAQTTLMVGHFQRFRRCPVAVKMLLDAGAIGRVRTMNVNLSEADRRPWLLQPESGGYLLGYGVHALDLVRWWAGSEVLRLCALCQPLGGEPNADASLVLMEFASGINASVQVAASPASVEPTQAGAVPFAATVIGESGVIQADMYGDVHLGTSVGWQTVASLPSWTDRNAFQRIEAYALEVREFVDAIVEGREPAIAGGDGIAAVKLALAAYDASTRKQWVDVHT